MAGQAQEPCAGDGCGQAQVVAAASQLDHDKNQFVAAVRQLIEAIPDASGATGTPCGPRRPAARVGGWDKSIRTYRAVVLEAAERASDAASRWPAKFERGNGREALKEAQAAGPRSPARDVYVLPGLAYDLAKAG